MTALRTWTADSNIHTPRGVITHINTSARPISRSCPLLLTRLLTRTVATVEEGENEKTASDELRTNSVRACRVEAAQLPAGSGTEGRHPDSRREVLPCRGPERRTPAARVDVSKRRFGRSHDKVLTWETPRCSNACEQTNSVSALHGEAARYPCPWWALNKPGVRPCRSLHATLQRCWDVGQGCGR